MTDKIIVAIHQPNLFPWLGYFNKIARADIFIFMDNAQFSKKGGTWSNRVKVAIKGQPSWITMPVVRAYHGVRRICDMEIDDTTFWRIKIAKTLQANYRRAPYFKEVYPFLETLISHKSNNVAEFNINAILALSIKFQFSPDKFIIGSTLKAEGKATNLLCSMVKLVGGTSYLCGGGSGGYQENEKFIENGIELVYQNFQHPGYSQINSNHFIPSLSIIDVLMNCGFTQTSKLLSGC